MGTGPEVVVVGSGVAGLAAALGAAGCGANVLVVEGAGVLGGTSALSGGVVWLPASPQLAAAGFHDSPAEALTYLRAVAGGELDDALARAFVDDAGRVATEVEERTPLAWEVLSHWPDYASELPGGKSGGRSMWPRTITMPRSLDAMVQGAPDQAGGPGRDAATESDGADNDGVVLRGPVRGRALVGGLVTGALDAGVRLRTGSRVSALVVKGDSIVGAEVDGERIDGRVVLATGGFQHDAALVADYLPGPPVVALGPPGCRGDGLRMARTVGATLANMDEGWWMPAMRVPGERFEDVAYYRPLHGERAKPGSIMIDGRGRRFVDEARNYGDVGRAMRAATGPGGATSHRGPPCRLVFDAAYRRRYPVGPLEPADPDPDWLTRADDLGALARAIGVPPATFADTVARFNASAVSGEDPDFGRGALSYDRWIGDHEAAHPTLAPLAEAPFYALPVHLGCMGTKGGPGTDDRGRVRSHAGRVVEGLYAAGNVAAGPFGSATPAGGATLGPALVFGFRAGEAAARDR